MFEFYSGKKKEYIVLGMLAVVLCFLKMAERNTPVINYSEAVFFVNYLIGSLFINYFLIPVFFNAKRYYLFVSGTVVVLIAMVLIDELVIENIVFPDTRGKYFNFINSLLDILPATALLVGYKFAWDTVQKESKLEAANRAIAEGELQLLSAQIHPHFLFNNLNNLYALALENSPMTPKIILELSSILRYMLHDGKEKYVSLAKEIQNLKSYIHLSELQLEERGTVNFSFFNMNEKLKIVPLIFIVFVENAFKHSMASLTEGININILIDVKDDILHFYCENNFSDKTNCDNLPKGIGLKNVKERLNLLYEDRHNLTIEKNSEKYMVSLKIDL